jgi:hypothetical protein
MDWAACLHALDASIVLDAAEQRSLLDAAVLNTACRDCGPCHMRLVKVDLLAGHEVGIVLGKQQNMACWVMAY